MEEELRSLLLVRFERPRLAYEWDGRPHRWVTVPAHGHTPFIRGERGPVDIRPGDYIVVEGDRPVDVISRDAVGKEYLPATRFVQTRNVETVYPTFDRAEHIPDRYSVLELKLIQGDLGQARSRGIIFVGEGRG